MVSGADVLVIGYVKLVVGNHPVKVTGTICAATSVMVVDIDLTLTTVTSPPQLLRSLITVVPDFMVLVIWPVQKAEVDPYMSQVAVAVLLHYGVSYPGRV